MCLSSRAEHDDAGNGGDQQDDQGEGHGEEVFVTALPLVRATP